MIENGLRSGGIDATARRESNVGLHILGVYVLSIHVLGIIIGFRVAQGIGAPGNMLGRPPLWRTRSERCHLAEGIREIPERHNVQQRPRDHSEQPTVHEVAGHAKRRRVSPVVVAQPPGYVGMLCSSAFIIINHCHYRHQDHHYHHVRTMIIFIFFPSTISFQQRY